MIKNIFKINFLNSDYNTVISKLYKGEFMVVPSGPGLATIDYDKKYWEALINSDFALPDSGFMVLLYNKLYNKRLKKFSGAKFIRKFINDSSIREPSSLFLINPSIKEQNANNIFLKEKNIFIDDSYEYVAPIYNKVEVLDSELLKKLEQLSVKPKFILINLGGGIQERLGSYLKNNLSYSPGIICTGAALSFLTGTQAKIPVLIDKLYLGWLARIFQNPSLFFLRYLKAFRLLYIFYLDKRGELI